MKVFHIDEFKCTLCSNWFCPPFTLPYCLKCTHSICTKCLEKSIENHSNQIICPEDLQTNKISQITINQSTKKALQRLLKQHKNLTQTNHLQCIKSLSITFDQLLDSKQIQLKNLSTLIDQIFENQIKRLRQIYEKIKNQINRPFRIVNDWKQVVRNYLKKIKNHGPSVKGSVSQFNHYIEQGRKIKLDLNQYLKHDFKELIDVLLGQPQICFTHNFSIFDSIENKENNHHNKFNTAKFETLGKKIGTTQKLELNQRQIFLQDMTNNFDQSSIREPQKTFQCRHQNSNKLSLFQQLIQQTPKIKKCSNSQVNEKSNKNPLKQMIFSSLQNIDDRDQNINRNTVKNFRKNQFQEQKQIRENKIKNNKLEILNTSTLQSGRKDYSNLLVQKIQKNKLRNQKQILKKQKFIGKSLQYSPDAPNYVQFESQTVQDTFYEEFNPFSNDRQISLQNQCDDQKQATNYNVNKIGKKTSREQLQKSKQNQYQEEQLLLEQKSQQISIQKADFKRNDWQLSHLNFLKEWKIQKGIKTQQIQIIQKQGGYNCEKQKNKYARRIQELKVRELMKQTTISENFISIVGQNLSQCNLVLLLSQIDWNYRRIQIVKLIKTGLNDIQFNQLLNFLVKTQVHTLMLSYNNLTELSLDALLHFVQINQTLKNIYLPKNNISLLKGNARPKINLLKQKGINLYI